MEADETFLTDENFSSENKPEDVMSQETQKKSNKANKGAEEGHKMESNIKVVLEHFHGITELYESDYKVREIFCLEIGKKNNLKK